MTGAGLRQVLWAVTLVARTACGEGEGAAREFVQRFVCGFTR